MRRFILIALTLSTAAPLSSQQVVRWQSAGYTVQGKVESIAPSGLLTVNAGSDVLVLVSPDTVPSLSVRKGGSLSRGTNAGIGAVIGSGVGLMLGVMASGHSCNPTEWCLEIISPAEATMALAAMGAVAGAIIGAIVVPAARWVPWQPSGTVARIRPIGGVNAAGDPKLGLKISF